MSSNPMTNSQQPIDALAGKLKRTEWPGRPSSVERSVRSPDRPVGTRHEEKTMTTCELDIASIRDRALLDNLWRETRKDR